MQWFPFHSIAFKAIVFCGTSRNLVGNSLVGTFLTLPNLGFLWVFFKYPKISKNGNSLFFPVSGGLLLWNQATFDSQIRERNGRGGRFHKSLVESLFPFLFGSPCAFVSFLPRKVWLALYHLFTRCIACS